MLTLYEIGVVAGAILLGLLSDKCTKTKRSPIAFVSVLMSTSIAATFTGFYENYPQKLWLTAMFFFGFFIGSMHHLICITVSADLGRSVINKRATSTITGIIDSFGSAGSGIGQVILGALIQKYGWRYGYFLPITCVIGCTLFPLTKILCNELSSKPSAVIISSSLSKPPISRNTAAFKEV